MHEKQFSCGQRPACMTYGGGYASPWLLKAKRPSDRFSILYVRMASMRRSTQPQENGRTRCGVSALVTIAHGLHCVTESMKWQTRRRDRKRQPQSIRAGTKLHVTLLTDPGSVGRDATTGARGPKKHSWPSCHLLHHVYCSSMVRRRTPSLTISTVSVSSAYRPSVTESQPRPYQVIRRSARRWNASCPHQAHPSHPSAVSVSSPCSIRVTRLLASHPDLHLHLFAPQSSPTASRFAQVKGSPDLAEHWRSSARLLSKASSSFASMSFRPRPVIASFISGPCPFN